MTISNDEILKVAPDVTPKAQKSKDYVSPFISLQSLESLCQGNETLDFCLKEVVMLCLRYAETVCRFEQIILRGQQSNEDDERKEIENLRTAVHDATIDSINSLSRNLKKSGKNNDWITKVSSSGRPSYGKFAILLAFEVVLQKGEMHE